MLLRLERADPLGETPPFDLADWAGSCNGLVVASIVWAGTLGEAPRADRLELNGLFRESGSVFASEDSGGSIIGVFGFVGLSSGLSGHTSNFGNFGTEL